MIYVIIMVALIVIGIVIMSRSNHLEEFGGFLLVVGLLQAVLAIFILLASYYGMTNLTVTYDNVAALYGETVDSYNGSVKDMLIEKGEIDNAITDFSQQGYQAMLGQMLLDQRQVLVSYNKLLGKKQIYKNNVFWSWLIIKAPERCVPIALY